MAAGRLLRPRVTVTLWASPPAPEGPIGDDPPVFDPVGEAGPGDVVLLISEDGRTSLVLSSAACGWSWSELFGEAER